MELFERCVLLLVGCAIGYILARIVDRLRAIEEELDDVDECVKRCQKDHKHLERRTRDERGFMRIPLVADVLYLSALVVVLWGVYMAQEAANDTERNTEQIGELAVCNTEYLKAQAEFLSIYLEQPPATSSEQRVALEEYFELLQAYTHDESSGLEDSSFTNNEALKQCVESNLIEEIQDE